MTGTTPSAAAPSQLRRPPYCRRRSALARAPAARPVDATVTVPGSKSLTNRYLVLAALADGPSRLRAPLRSRDSSLMTEALRQLGVGVAEVPGTGRSATTWKSRPIGWTPPRRTRHRLRPGRHRHALRAAGGGAAPRRVPLRRRPARPQTPDGPIIEALSGLGVAVNAPDGGPASSLPFTVHGTGEVRGGHLIIDASASSQFVSALLLAGARFTEGLHLEHQSSEHVGKPVPSLDHINMTVAVLRGVGVAVDDSVPNQWDRLPRPDPRLRPADRAGPLQRRALPRGGPGHPRHRADPELARRDHPGRRPLARHSDRHGRDRDNGSPAP